MILNKKTAICLSICLLVFNKQSLASVPAVDSNSLASALELASVVQKQVEADKKKKKEVSTSAWKKLKAKGEWKSFINKANAKKFIDGKGKKIKEDYLDDRKAKKAAADKAAKDAAAKEKLNADKAKLNADIEKARQQFIEHTALLLLRQLWEKSILTYAEAELYNKTMSDFSGNEAFEKFGGALNFIKKFISDKKNNNKKINIDSGEIIE